MVHHTLPPGAGQGEAVHPVADKQGCHVSMMLGLGGKDQLPRCPQLERESDRLDAGAQGDGLCERNREPCWIPVTWNSVPCLSKSRLKAPP